MHITYNKYLDIFNVTTGVADNTWNSFGQFNDPKKLVIDTWENEDARSLTNALLKKNRSIVSTTAGTTRDSIDASIKWYGNKINLIDTAGLRKLSKIKDKIEYYSTLRTKSAIFRSNIVLVLIDAEKGFTRQDKSIIDETIKEGKGLVIELTQL